MADATHADMARPGGLFGLVQRANSALAAVPQSIALLALRFALAVPFLKSGWLKWDGFLTLSAGAKYVFQEEFKLHILGAEYAYPVPLTMAFLAGLGEIILPVLLIVGLGTRFAALGLLIMTAVIQLTVPEGWANFHLPWAAMALALIVYGGGRISADQAIGLNIRR
jgi:putative oxidoreductase